MYVASGDYLQFTMNKLSIETKLFIKLFKLAQCVKFVLALIYGKLQYISLLTEIGPVRIEIY